jgi:hypothetical protein
MTSQVFVPPGPLQTAVLFLVFNRPDTTEQVFKAIRQARPPRLYVAADGARNGRLGEAERVEKVRKIATEVDWPCEVKTLFRENNLGCKFAVSRAITWFFESEKQGIILEDDCLPAQSFFWYCEDLLNKYKDDQSIYLISGDARGPEAIGMEEDYGFCKYPLIWGWASWRRVWSMYDVELNQWGKDGDRLLNIVTSHKPTKIFWSKAFKGVRSGKINTWDYQLVHALLINKGKCVVPRCNLISNIGFGSGATHTTNKSSQEANRQIFDIRFPLRHNPSHGDEIRINYFLEKTIFCQSTIFERVIKKLKTFFKRSP